MRELYADTDTDTGAARQARQGLVAGGLVHDRHAASDVLGESTDLAFGHRPAGGRGDLILRYRR
jgi:hypothetical protein